jgi:hypothetical protein
MRPPPRHSRRSAQCPAAAERGKRRAHRSAARHPDRPPRRARATSNTPRRPRSSPRPSRRTDASQTCSWCRGSERARANEPRRTRRPIATRAVCATERREGTKQPARPAVDAGVELSHDAMVRAHTSRESTLAHRVISRQSRLRPLLAGLLRSAQAAPFVDRRGVLRGASERSGAVGVGNRSVLRAARRAGAPGPRETEQKHESHCREALSAHVISSTLVPDGRPARHADGDPPAPARGVPQPASRIEPRRPLRAPSPCGRPSARAAWGTERRARHRPGVGSSCTLGPWRCRIWAPSRVA